MPKTKKAKPVKKVKRSYIKKKIARWADNQDPIPVVPVMPPTRLIAKRSARSLKRKKDHADAMYTVLKELRRVVFIEGGDTELMAVALDAVRVLRIIDNEVLRTIFDYNTKGGRK